jgi:hypothetical protein
VYLILTALFLVAAVLLLAVSVPRSASKHDRRGRFLMVGTAVGLLAASLAMVLTYASRMD